jgi:hypothetical protein
MLRTSIVSVSRSLIFLPRYSFPVYRPSLSQWIPRLVVVHRLCFVISVTAEVKNAWSCTCAPPLCCHGVDRDSFTLSYVRIVPRLSRRNFSGKTGHHRKPWFWVVLTFVRAKQSAGLHMLHWGRRLCWRAELRNSLHILASVIRGTSIWWSDDWRIEVLDVSLRRVVLGVL